MLKYFYKNITSALIIIGFFTLTISTAHARENSIVVLQYHNVGDYPLYEDAISVEEFTTHIKELKKNRHTLLPLAEAVELLKSKQVLPEKAVSIIFNNTNLNAIETILPILETYKIPVTILLNTINMNASLENLKDNSLIEFGMIPTEGKSLIGETPEDQANKINTAITKYRELFENNPKIFAYPEGEYSNQIMKRIDTYKFTTALTQTSGVVHTETNFSKLPTILIDKKYALTEQFMMIANSLPLYVSDVIPQDNLIDTTNPVIGFTIDNNGKHTEQISCFASDIGKLETKLITDNRVEIRPSRPFISRSTHVKCTLQDGKSWRQFSINLINPSIEQQNAQPIFKENTTQ